MKATASPLLVRMARKALAGTAPGLYRKVSYYRNEGRLLRITRKLVSRYGCRILCGPFQGMCYFENSIESVLNPKLVGSYEEELHPVVEHAIAQDYETIIDIGCAEGYYAVGLLFRNCRSRCIAFDLDARATVLCKEMAELNGVSSRLRVLGQCDTISLRARAAPRSFLVVDCEGAELELLDPNLVPNLRSCDILVELHDFLRPGLSATLLQRFDGSHDTRILDQTDRNPARYPQLSFLSKIDRRFAVEEFRPARMQWAFLRARNGR